MSSLLFAPNLPELRPLREDVDKSKLITPPLIRFQFQPTGMTKNVSGNWASATTMSREHPILQFSNGEQIDFIFQARLFARDATQDVQEQIDALEQSTQRDPKLKRPFRWEFIWGPIRETVVVQSVGNIQFDDIRPDGSLRGATLQIRLLLYRSVDVELTGQPLPSTFFGVTRSGDQWEDIALKEYDDPLLGDLLRRRNPAALFPGNDPGRVVLLPPVETLRDEVLEPDSGPLRRTPEGMALRQKVYDKRSVSRESAIILE